MNLKEGLYSVKKSANQDSNKMKFKSFTLHVSFILSLLAVGVWSVAYNHKWSYCINSKKYLMGYNTYLSHKLWSLLHCFYEYVYNSSFLFDVLLLLLLFKSGNVLQIENILYFIAAISFINVIMHNIKFVK